MLAIRVSKIQKAAAIAMLAAGVAGQAHAQSNVLTDTSGMTVYTFDKDNNGRSTCYAQCAAAWPPVSVARMPFSAEFSVTFREDGAQQVAYRGRPLYFFVGDRKPGDMNGDNVQNVWHVVVPLGKAAAIRAPQAVSAYGY